MRVLHIINNLHTGGAEKLLVETLSLYPNYGVSADVLLLDTSKTPFLNILKKNFKGNILVSSVKNIYSPLQIFEIRKYLEKGYDIIHVHLFPVLYWVSLAKFLKKTTSKVIFTEHNTDNKRLQNIFFRQVDRIIYKQYDKIIAITLQVKNVLIEKLKIPAEKIEVIHNGINIKKIQSAQAYNKSCFFDNKSFILIQVSRFQIQKDQKTVIQALNLLPFQYKLLLVGDGETKKESEALVEELKLNERVKFLGVRMDIPELIKTSDIVIQSSHWEGFGLAAVEGMAAGKPVIASNVPGLANLVKDAGILFEKGNENDLAEKILAMESLDDYNLISQRCLERAKIYNLDFMVESTAKLYHSLLV